MPALPEVSVVIPTHNRWPLVAASIEGVLAQEDVELELIVVDDGSTDETPTRLAAVTDPRVRVLRNDRALGVSGARNRGIDCAQGEWIAFLDDDDLWSPRKLRLQVDAAREAGAVWVYSAGVSIDERRAVIGIQTAPPADEVEQGLLRFNVVPCGCSNVVARAEVVRAVGGFDHVPSIAADWAMWLALSGEGPAASVAEPLVAYLEHTSNMSVRGSRDIWTDLEYFAEKFHGRGLDPDHVLISRWVAGSHRRAGDRRGALRAYLHGAARFHSAGNLTRAAALLLGERVFQRFGERTGAGATAPPWLQACPPPVARESLSS